VVTSIADYFENNLGLHRKVYLGCGSDYREGWCNVDWYEHQSFESHRGHNVRVDVKADITNLGLPPDYVDCFFASHVFEHFYRFELIMILEDLFNALRPGGLLISEMPDFRRLILLSALLPKKPPSADPSRARDLITSQFYGASWETNPAEYSYHKYVWSKAEFGRVLSDLGFEIVLLTGATLTHHPGRDFAVVARKPGGSEYGSQQLQFELLNQIGGRFRRLERQARSILRLVGRSHKQY
jgi:hypothetical protein